jgi:hypothetical protein
LPGAKRIPSRRLSFISRRHRYNNFLVSTDQLRSTAICRIGFSPRSLNRTASALNSFVNHRLLSSISSDMVIYLLVHQLRGDPTVLTRVRSARGNLFHAFCCAFMYFFLY